MKGRVLLLTEAGIIEGEHHQHPNPHIVGKGLQPAPRRSPALRHSRQPVAGIAKLGDSHAHGDQHANDVDRQKSTIELVQPVLNTTEDQRYAEDSHNGRGDRHGKVTAPFGKNQRHHITLEHSVIERRGKEDERSDHGPHMAKQDLGEQSDGQPGLHGKTADHSIDHSIGDHGEHDTDQRIGRTVAACHGRSHHHVEDSATDCPPGHHQVGTRHTPFVGYWPFGEVQVGGLWLCCHFEIPLLCLFSRQTSPASPNSAMRGASQGKLKRPPDVRQVA